MRETHNNNSKNTEYYVSNVLFLQETAYLKAYKHKARLTIYNKMWRLCAYEIRRQRPINQYP